MTYAARSRGRKGRIEARKEARVRELVGDRLYVAHHEGWKACERRVSAETQRARVEAHENRSDGRIAVKYWWDPPAQVDRRHWKVLMPMSNVSRFAQFADLSSRRTQTVDFVAREWAVSYETQEAVSELRWFTWEVDEGEARHATTRAMSELRIAWMLVKQMKPSWEREELSERLDSAARALAVELGRPEIGVPDRYVEPPLGIGGTT